MSSNHSTAFHTDNQQALEFAREAQDNIMQAIESLKSYVQLTGDHSIERTLIATLEVLASREHQWLDRSENLDDLLDSIQDSIRDEDEDEEIDYAMLWEATNR